jgi:hypothetical protein
VIKRNPRGTELDAALELYTRRIPEDEQDSPADIVRWLHEAEEYGGSKKFPYREWFLIAKVNAKVCGLLYLTHYDDCKATFLSYLVADDSVPEAQHYAATSKLLKEALHVLPRRGSKCRLIVAEIDRFFYRKVKANRIVTSDVRGKVKLFQGLAANAGFRLWELGNVPYRQPDLTSKGDRTREKPMLLLLARSVKNYDFDEQPSRDDIREALQFIYLKLYGDCFRDDAERDVHYRKYVSRLYDEVWMEYVETEHASVQRNLDR